MPQALDRGDRKLLIGAAILLVIVMAASSLTSPPENSGMAAFPSSYSPAWDGSKAAFLLLKDMGYDVERWEKSPTQITSDPSHTVLVLANPVEAPSEDERAAISDFLQAGGRVFATGPSASMLLPQASSFPESYEFERVVHFSPRAPSPIMRDAPDITMSPPESWSPQLPEQVIVYANEDTAAVITYRFGKGEVVWWGAATPLTNGAIRDASNIELFLNSVAPSRDVHILWDEYFHGAHDSLWAYFGRTPLPWGVVQFGIVFLAILATYSRRAGPVRAPAAVSRLSPLELVETLGDLYHSAHADAAAVQATYRRLRFMLVRALGVSANASDADLARLASQRLWWDEAPLLETLTAAERASREGVARQGDSLPLVQRLFDYTSRLELRGGQTQTRKSG